MPSYSKGLKGFSNSNMFSWAMGLRLLFLLLTLYTILINAWVGDDIQITFRQVWNFINGDGITFNYGERVQVFTHPLWFLTLSAVSFLTRELFLTTIVTCVILSILSIILLLKIEQNVFRDRLPVISPIFVLIFSWAFVDYATSGLENSLSYFLTGLLFFLLFREKFEQNTKWIYLILALLVLNRFDYAVLFLPLALVLIPKTRSFKGFVRAVWLGVLLIALWLLFASFYFGFPMPNTYYAKLNADYPSQEVLFRGLRYFLALRLDHVSSLAMCVGLILSLLSLNRYLIALATGQVAYLFYIYQIGGDFMQGRFFALPVYLSVGQIILFFAFKSDWRERLTFKPVLVFLMTAATIGIFSGYPSLSGLVDKTRKPVTGIYDEKSYYYHLFGLFSKDRRSWPQIASLPKTQPTEYRITRGYIGMLSLNDASHHLIDTSALSDPFLARMPAIRIKNWRIGHHQRKMPQEYGEFLIGNIEELPDKKLNGLLSDVKIATRNDLLSRGRLGAIWRLSTNYHNSRIDFSKYQNPVSFIPSTASVEILEVKDWRNALKFDDLPEIYEYEFRRFNNNLKIVSETPEIAYGVSIEVDNIHVYDLYANDKKIQRIEILDIPEYYREKDTHVVMFENPISVKSITLKSVEVNYADVPAFNFISKINLIPSRI